MGLTIDSMGIYNAPVFDSASRWTLVKGVAHIQRLPCHGHRPLGETSTWQDIAWVIGERGDA
jgi:hypothetical protein